MRTSTETDKLAPALAKAQAKLINPVRNRKVKVKSKKSGAEFEYSYATFDKVLDLARPTLAENEIAVMQDVSYAAERWTLTTRLMHSSGQWIEGDTPLPYSGSTDAQELGSALSYARRYGLAPLLGITAEEDDDGGRTGGRANGNAKPDPVLESWKKKLADAGAISALSTAWNDMGQQYRKVLAAEKEAAKVRIQEAERIAAEAT